MWISYIPLTCFRSTMHILRDDNLLIYQTKITTTVLFEPEEVTDYPDYLFLNITTKHAQYILY